MKSLKEYYGSEARVQLSFSSWMKLSSFFSLSFSLLAAIVILLKMSSTPARGVSDSELFYSQIWLFVYMLIGLFLVSILSSALIYPVYSYICSRSRGQRLFGKFAILVEVDEKTTDQEKKPD